MVKEFVYNLKIYYEDTDAGGVVYYANYLKFLERARTDAIFSLGFTNTEIKKKFDIIFVVKSCNINYLKPLKFEDNLSVISKFDKLTKTSFIMNQTIIKNKIAIVEAKIHLVFVDEKIKPIKIPKLILDKLNPYISNTK